MSVEKRRKYWAGFEPGSVEPQMISMTPLRARLLCLVEREGSIVPDILKSCESRSIFLYWSVGAVQVLLTS